MTETAFKVVRKVCDGGYISAISAHSLDYTMGKITTPRIDGSLIYGFKHLSEARTWLAELIRGGYQKNMFAIIMGNAEIAWELVPKTCYHYDSTREIEAWWSFWNGANTPPMSDKAPPGTIWLRWFTPTIEVQDDDGL